MADIQHYRTISGKSVLYGSLAGVAVGGPLLGMMGFSFLATVTLLLIASPLLLLFSPLLLCAAFALSCAVAGFTVTAAVAVVGAATLGWVSQQLGLGVNRARLLGIDRAVDELVDGGGEAVKEQGHDLHQRLPIE